LLSQILAQDPVKPVCPVKKIFVPASDLNFWFTLALAYVFDY
jgi:hypothetical protein